MGDLGFDKIEGGVNVLEPYLRQLTSDDKIILYVVEVAKGIWLIQWQEKQ